MGLLLCGVKAWTAYKKISDYNEYQKKLTSGIVFSGDLAFHKDPSVYTCNGKPATNIYILLWLEASNPYSNDPLLVQERAGLSIVHVSDSLLSVFAKYDCEKMFKENKRLKVTVEAKALCETEWDVLQLISVEEVYAEYGLRCDL
jgi:hypothetical protein